MEKETLHQVLNRIQKELKAPKGQFNPFGKFNYRSCEFILEAVKPLLGTATLMLSDEIVLIGDRYYVKATAGIYEGGSHIFTTAYARESLDKKGMDTAQITGATSSYARKYALNGLFAIDDEKDPDTKDNTNGKQNGHVAVEDLQGPPELNYEMPPFTGNEQPIRQLQSLQDGLHKPPAKQKVLGEKCECGGTYVMSKSNNIYCERKCWLNKK